MHLVDNIAVSLLSKPFVVLYGPSGTGKTRAAIELSLKINEHYFNHNWFDIVVNRNGEIVSGNSVEFRDMVARNESQGNNFLLSNNNSLTNINLEFCESIEFEDDSVRAIFLNNDENHLRIAANILEEVNCYKIIPVGSNWTDTKPLIGYVNPFGENGQTVYQITPFIELLLLASHPENSGKPFFAILDEMNLSHVEYYLSDILSIMETAQYTTQYILSNNELNIIANTLELNPTPYHTHLLGGIRWLLAENRGLTYPNNLFIIGTINLDETTQMLSNKVLDRAHLIKVNTELPSTSIYIHNYSSEFSNDEFNEKFTDLLELRNNNDLNTFFVSYYNQLISDLGITLENTENILSLLDQIYIELEKIDQQYGFRVTKELFVYLIFGMRYYGHSNYLKELLNNALNQKVLVKLHGNKRVLNPILTNLINILTTNLFTEADSNYFKDVIDRLENLKFRLDLRSNATFIS
jgi:hypothetical protein